MHYLVLLHDTPDPTEVPGSPAWDEELAAFERFDQRAGDAVVGGEALDGPNAEVRVRHAPDAAPVVVDTTFPETAEVLGGYYVFEADDLDAALELAAAIPTAARGTLEVRPVVDEVWQPDTEAAPGATRWFALLTGEPTEADHPGTDAWDAAVAAHTRFEQQHGPALLGGAALHPAETATTLRVRDGQVLLTDGPFVETAEVVGGFYVWAAATPDEAVAIARDVPMGAGTVVLRPIVELDG
jgi:hypothetical protein